MVVGAGACGSVGIVCGGVWARAAWRRGQVQLKHAPAARDDRQQDAQGGGEQQRHAQRQSPVRAEVRDVSVLPVLENEDQQEQQHDRPAGQRDPRPPRRLRMTGVTRPGRWASAPGWASGASAASRAV